MNDPRFVVLAQPRSLFTILSRLKVESLEHRPVKVSTENDAEWLTVTVRKAVEQQAAINLDLIRFLDRSVELFATLAVGSLAGGVASLVNGKYVSAYVFFMVFVGFAGMVSIVRGEKRRRMTR